MTMHCLNYSATIGVSAAGITDAFTYTVLGLILTDIRNILVAQSYRWQGEVYETGQPNIFL